MSTVVPITWCPGGENPVPRQLFISHQVRKTPPCEPLRKGGKGHATTLEKRLVQIDTAGRHRPYEKPARTFHAALLISG
jgi:hypothetical protein